MNQHLEHLAKGASDVTSFARALGESGLRSASDLFKGVQLFGALNASEEEGLEFDETHYFLVPVIGSNVGSAIYTKRILPLGYGASNSLPKKRVFHVPDATVKELLERELVANLVEQRHDEESAHSEVADRLEALANKIDCETNKVTGGLVLIGGVVAIANPLLGVGIAAKALLPSLSAKVSKMGVDLVGAKLRDFKKSKIRAKVEKGACKEVRKMKPELFVNPILKSLDAIALQPNSDFDPAMERENDADSFEHARYYQATSEAVCEVYRANWKELDLRDYQVKHRKWIESFCL